MFWQSRGQISSYESSPSFAQQGKSDGTTGVSFLKPATGPARVLCTDKTGRSNSRADKSLGELPEKSSFSSTTFPSDFFLSPHVTKQSVFPSHFYALNGNG